VTAHPRPHPDPVNRRAALTSGDLTAAGSQAGAAAFHLGLAAGIYDATGKIGAPELATAAYCLTRAAGHLGLAVIPLTDPDAARHAIRQHAADLGLICYEAEQQTPYLGRFGEAV
jgi:hypothetical protein